MAYTVKTNSTHSKWWFTGTSTDANNRLSDLIADQADGPYYDVASAWTQSAGDPAEYYHAPTKRPDNVYVSGAKLTEMPDDTCIDGGGGGLANGEWCWMTANSRVYVQIAAGSPGANADFYYDWYGSISATNFMQEVITDQFYRIYKAMETGDGSTSTTLYSRNGETVYFDSGVTHYLKVNATLQLGQWINNAGANGATWIFNAGVIFLYPFNTAMYGLTGGTFSCYGSTIYSRGDDSIYFLSPSTTVKDSTVHNFCTSNRSVVIAGTWDRCLISFSNTARSVNLGSYNGPTSVFTNIITNAVSLADYISASDCTVTGITLANDSAILLNAFSNLFTGVDMSVVNTPQNQQAGSITAVANTINIDAANKIGQAVQSVTVATTYDHIVEGTDGNTYRCIQNHTAVDATHKPITGVSWSDYWQLVPGASHLDGEGGDWETGAAYKYNETAFSVSTAADGTITEQTIESKRWSTTSELKRVRVYKFTYSKVGYLTLVEEDILLTKPIDWHKELQPIDFPVYAWILNV